MSATALPADVVELLQAIHDALIVPAAKDPVDDLARLALFDRRTGDVRVVVAHLLKSQYLTATDSAETLRTWTAERPVTYAPFIRMDDQ
ncbi:hypothetical protein [Streptomyces sp. PH10-H1]|uniref:hypothetical protein n=1 Tax=Streptomyces sp. PH10-H1 TaxID=3046212 RepID=UPI0024BB5F5A|nr:hypothetical protein [Streptomyces sp. PH10-H1]MDJ0346747.1 hypothetical protein [Streptomyces sp. PH10-H1]